MCKTVSIIVPVYNSSEFLSDTLTSIVNQTYKNYEIILVDDGSTDSSGEICDLWASRYKNITAIHTDNAGPSVARNRGIHIANGEYILPVDSDDIIDESYVEKAAKVLDSDEKVGIVYCKAILFGDASGDWNIPIFSMQEMLVSNCIFSSAMFYKRDWEKIGGYSSAMKYGFEDYDFWLSIISLGKQVFQIPEILFRYRKHNGSRSVEFEKNPLLVEITNNLKFTRHKELYKKFYYAPKPNNVSVSYGCGGAGKSYINYLKSVGKIEEIKYCVDKNYGNISWKENIKIESPSILLDDKTYDIIIALNKKSDYIFTKQMLLDYGYSNQQIHWYINERELDNYNGVF